MIQCSITCSVKLSLKDSAVHWKRERQCRQTPSRLGRPHSRQNLEAENPENVSNYLSGKCVSRLHKNKQMYTFEYLRIGPYMAGRGQVTRHICKYKRLTLWGAVGKFPRRWEVEGEEFMWGEHWQTVGMGRWVSVSCELVTHLLQCKMNRWFSI